jgi:hypothetical protein
MKFVHASDLHLDSPLRGLARYEGAPVERIRRATRRALESLVELCIGERVSLLVMAGDIYDGDWRDYSTGLFFAGQMSRLRAAGVPVVMIHGNHDAASQITKHLTLPDNVTVLGHRRPETKVFADLGICVHGQSFAKRDVKDDLASRYPEPIRGLLNVGLLHTALAGRPGHEPYAPTSLEALVAKGYEYWALGHVHQREVLHRDPWVVFSGNLQGRHARETGAKGAMLVEFDGPKVHGVSPVALDAARWHELVLDSSLASSPSDVLEGFSCALEELLSGVEGRLLLLRLRLTVPSRLEASLRADAEQFENELRSICGDVSPGSIWLERVLWEKSANVTTSSPIDRDDAIFGLVESLRAVVQSPERLARISAEFSELIGKLPTELRAGPDGIRVDNPALWQTLAPEVEQLLVSRLLAKGSE